jgi:serpin B
MDRRALLLSGASAALAACAGLTDDGQTGQPSAAPAADFDVALYRALAAGGGNQFISPFSVSSAFALLYPGARGETAAQFVDVFGFDPSPEAQAERVRTLAEALRSDADGALLSIADAAWVERTMGLAPEYAALIRDQLGATIEAVDFIADQPAALARINDWASSATNGRVPSILTSPNPDRRLVLTNAVYFKGRWRDEFYEKSTIDGEFHAESGQAVPARLMHKIDHVPYFEEGGVQVADFGYVGDFALSVFLPRESDGLAAFERRLTAGRLARWLSRLENTDPREYEDLEVTFPKVELAADYELGAQLQSLGLTRAFSPADADLSGLTGERNLNVSAVVHKSFLAIDEEGTEAAAVTAVDIVVTSGRIPGALTEFKADRPFFIVLRHTPTGTPLFLGRIATV